MHEPPSLPGKPTDKTPDKDRNRSWQPSSLEIPSAVPAERHLRWRWRAPWSEGKEDPFDGHIHGLRRRLERGGPEHFNRQPVVHMVWLKSLQRRDFPLWLYRNPLWQLLVHTVLL